MITEESLNERGIVAQAELDPDSCEGCVFHRKFGCIEVLCTAEERDAPHNVIWVRKEVAR